MSLPNVAVNIRRGRLFVISTYSPGPGTYVDCEPVFVIPAYEVDLIGQRVIDALLAFVDCGSIPDWGTYLSPVLKAAGVDSWAEFQKGLKDCVVKQADDKLIIRSDCGATAVARDASNSEIGDAVLKALGTSREKELIRAKRRGEI